MKTQLASAQEQVRKQSAARDKIRQHAQQLKAKYLAGEKNCRSTQQQLNETRSELEQMESKHVAALAKQEQQLTEQRKVAQQKQQKFLVQQKLQNDKLREQLKHQQVAAKTSADLARTKAAEGIKAVAMIKSLEQQLKGEKARIQVLKQQKSSSLENTTSPASPVVVFKPNCPVPAAAKKQLDTAQTKIKALEQQLNTFKAKKLKETLLHRKLVTKLQDQLKKVLARAKNVGTRAPAPGPKTTKAAVSNTKTAMPMPHKPSLAVSNNKCKRLQAELSVQKQQAKTLSLRIKTLENQRKQLLVKLKARGAPQSKPTQTAKTTKKRKIDGSGPTATLGAKAPGRPTVQKATKGVVPGKAKGAVATPKTGAARDRGNTAGPSKVEKLSKLTKTLKAKLIKMFQDKKSLGTEIATLRKTTKELQIHVTTLKKERGGQQKRLQAQAEAAAKEKDTATSAIADLKERLGQTERKYHDCVLARETQLKRVGVLESQFAHAKDTAAAHADKLAADVRASAQRGKEASARIQALTQEEKKTKTELEMLTKEFALAKATNDTKYDQMRSAARRWMSKSREFEAMVKAMKAKGAVSAAVAKWRRKCAELEKHQEKERKKLDEHQQKFGSLQAALEELTHDHELQGLTEMELRDEIKQLQEEAARLPHTDSTKRKAHRAPNIDMNPKVSKRETEN